MERDDGFYGGGGVGIDPFFGSQSPIGGIIATPANINIVSHERSLNGICP